MNKTAKTMFGAIILAVILTAGLRTKAVRVGGSDTYAEETRTSITTLDTLDYDGATLAISYTLTSACAAREHSTEIVFDTEKQSKNIVAFKPLITDISPENACRGALSPVTIKSTLAIKRELKAATEDLIRQGYTIDAAAFIYMPHVRPLLAGADEVIGNTGGTSSAPVINDYEISDDVEIPATVNVTVVEYEPGFKCDLWKKDGARKDGFTGYGSTLAEARQDAANACARTNHPHCIGFSQDPSHTTCDVSFKETEKLVEYSSSDLPDGSFVDSWGCTLWKKDGARNDGFKGNGKTLAEARQAAAKSCKATNNPNCEKFSKSKDHIQCLPAVRYNAPKPQAQWSCTLWKKDGARKDGFKGTGSTESEARRNTIPGCLNTNNPNCETYAMDPAHTQCDVEFYVPE